ncbi:PHD domain-containing protein [Cryptosporidium canis]|uniref:PHD domain-containing protein n=1 Tax=Cryptosporidium canis TaxID=195482 RepID=A0A9D5DK14_9CRYT|nr:PHD domain-containing protein [Cryptosporidium canis]
MQENSHEIVTDKNEPLQSISTECTIDDSASTNSFSINERLNEELFESDYWDDYSSDSEKESDRGISGKSSGIYPKKRVWNDNLERSCGTCNYIESDTELSNMIKCEGYCRRPYHLKCVGLDSLPDTRWKCKNCLNNLVFCNICNSYGNKSDHNFLKCYHPICMRFFHTHCILNHHSNIIWTYNYNSCGQACEAPVKRANVQPEINIGGNILKKIFGTEEVERENLTLRLLNEFGFKFICHRHYCSSCSCYVGNNSTHPENSIETPRKKRTIFRLDNPDNLVYCIKCNSGYHNNCLHPDSVKLVNGVCICYKHIHDQSEMILGRYDIKESIAPSLNKRLKKALKLRNGEAIDKDLKISLIQNITNHLNSSNFEINSFPFELPGQSKDWLYTELENIVDENEKSENQRIPDYIKNYGFTPIKKNIYIENIGDIQEMSDSPLLSTDSSERKCRQKRTNSAQNSKKRTLSNSKRDEIFSEKCVCRTICDKDTCQNAAMYMECYSNICGLDESLQKVNCMNRIFNSNGNKFLDNQKKIILKNLKVVDAGEKGFGVATRMSIPKDTFIIEYVGEVLRKESYLKRVEQYKKRELESREKSSTDNFISKDTRERHWYCMEIGNDYIIDSTHKGNLSRLINHSCNPNCVAQKWLVGNECRVGIFSQREIKPDEELTYDYSFSAFDIGFRCKCNSSSCKGRIGIDNFKESNKELVKKRNTLCTKSTMLNSFICLNKSLLSNPLFSELDEIFSSRFDYIKDTRELYNQLEKLDSITKYNELLHDHIISKIQIYPHDFKYRNSLYGYTSLSYFDSPDIISNWYLRKSKDMVLMSKPWIILPFVFNSREFSHSKYPSSLHYLKKQICKRLSIYFDQKQSNLSNNSLFWHLFDLGIGGDECCNICNNPGTLITCDYCYDSFHKYCLYNNEIPNNLKRSRLSYNYSKMEEKIKCKSCTENELLSVYWLKTTYKRRKYNYLLKHKLFSIPSFIQKIDPQI